MLLPGGPKLYSMTLGILLDIPLILNRCDPHVFLLYCLSTEHVPVDLSDSIGCCCKNLYGYNLIDYLYSLQCCYDALYFRKMMQFSEFDRIQQLLF